MILILDSSVIIATLLSTGKNHTRHILKLAKNKSLHLAVCEETLAELKVSLKDDNVKRVRHYNSHRNAVFIAWYTYNSKWYSLTHDVPSVDLRDPNDRIYLKLADASNADYLITVDNDLLALKQYKNTFILTPKEFIERTA